MESRYSPENIYLVQHILSQVIEACTFIMSRNESIVTADDYLTSPEGMEKLAAACMLIESIGESIKKIDRLAPDFLMTYAPSTPWRQIKGLRDHIAHGYFDLDADIIYDVVKNELLPLRQTLCKLRQLLMKS